jgi:pimeloyl-ACP methyl ester carboxylesterase
MTINLKKIAALLFLIFGIFSFNSYSQEKPRRFIFLIHGVGSSEKAFGNLPDILVDQGHKIQPGYDIQVIPISYATGRDGFTTYDFARDLGSKIQNQIPNLRPTDRITLVAHSQGGLVSWIWYLTSLDINNDKIKYFESLKPYAMQTEGIMTLGSPIWGSKLASILNAYPTLLKLAKKIGIAIGDQEAQEMSYNSETILRFRKKAIQLDEANYRVPLRTASIAGVLPASSQSDIILYYKPLISLFEKYFGSGLGRMTESDIAVAVPSARLDFIYLKSAKQKEKQIQLSDFTHFNDTSIGNLYVVQGVHANPTGKGFYDIAEVPEKCNNIQKPCTHPTFPLILQFTMACTKEIVGCNKDVLDSTLNTFFNSKDWVTRRKIGAYDNENMHTFIVDLTVDFPETYSLPKNDPQKLLKYLTVSNTNNEKYYSPNPKDDSYHFLLLRRNEVMSSSVKIEQFRLEPPYSPLLNQARITLHGQVYLNSENSAKFREQARKGFKLPLQIQFPGLEKRTIDVLIKPTYTTFMNIDLRN